MPAELKIAFLFPPQLAALCLEADICWSGRLYIEQALLSIYIFALGVRLTSRHSALPAVLRGRRSEIRPTVTTVAGSEPWRVLQGKVVHKVLSLHLQA